MEKKFKGLNVNEIVYTQKEFLEYLNDKSSKNDIIVLDESLYIK